MEIIEAANRARVATLEYKVTQARTSYYNGIPTVPDDTYDAWIDELAELRVDSPAVLAIGAEATSAWPKVEHTIPMGSLTKVNTLEEVVVWLNRVSRGEGASFEELFITEKMDGLSVSVTYDKGKLIQGVTRGDGLIGEDITPNVARMEGVPTTLPQPSSVTLRGEIVMHKEALVTHFPGKANTRNAASGTSRRLDGVGSEHLSVYFFQVADGIDFTTEVEQFMFMQEALKLKVPNFYVSGMAPNIRTPHDIWLDYQQKIRDGLPYEIDGLVVRLNSLELQHSLGEKDNRPVGATAFKFAPVTRESTLRKFTWQVGGTGRITPVAGFDPVRLVGAKVTQASCYNLKYLLDNQIGLRCKILVARANDVIPRVVSTTKQVWPKEKWDAARAGDKDALKELVDYPFVCPACGAETTRDGEYVVCPNQSECPAQAVGRLQAWVKELGILGWGESLLTKLVEGEHALTPADLYRLSGDVLASLEGMGESSADNVLKTLHAAKELPLENFLGGCSIPLCSTSTVEALMAGGLDTLEAIKGATAAQLETIAGVGPKRASSLIGWLADHTPLLDDLIDAGVSVKEQAKGALSGKLVSFTGTSKLKRNQLKALARAAGGKVKDSVTKTTDFLVMADPDSQTAKAKGARKNGTRCISEEGFLEMVGYDG